MEDGRGGIVYAEEFGGSKEGRTERGMSEVRVSEVMRGLLLLLVVVKVEGGKVGMVKDERGI